MPKFRKKPVVIEAVKWTGDNVHDLYKLGMIDFATEFTSDDLLIETLEGEMRAIPGDWIIKGIKGEFYPCKSDIFYLTYEEVTE